MPLRLVVLSLLLAVATLSAQSASCGGDQAFRILHFTKTSGFDHRTRASSAQLFTDLGQLDNYTITDTEDQAVFDDLAVLRTYETIVFSNTSGNIPFTATQRANLEAYINGGGGFLGIHAATDMYRDGSYPFYTRLVGGSRRNSPAHTSSGNVSTMDVIGTHPSTANLPNPWTKQEEYYYWPDTGLVAGITEVLRVRNTGGSNAYQDARPMSWYQAFDSGARSFYTALGHASSNYTDADNDFRQHLRDALCWTVLAEPSVLPVHYLGSELRQLADGRHAVRWEVAGDRPRRVELHGGPTDRPPALLATTDAASATGELSYRPDQPAADHRYRLRFVDPDGGTQWGEWHLAAGRAAAALSVVYAAGVPLLVNAGPAPVAVEAFDVWGRRVRSWTAAVGRTRISGLRRGMYFLRGAGGLGDWVRVW